MTHTSTLLAMAQMQVWPGELERNLHRATELVEEASASGAHVVLLPEAMDLGWAHLPSAVQALEIPQGKTCQHLVKLARSHRIHICSGLTERDGEAIYNAAVLIDPDGNICLHHRKIHELEFAQKLYRTGDRLAVCDTAIGRIGLMICADAFVPDRVIARALGQMGAQLIVSPCAWAVPPDHDQMTQPYGQLWLDSYAPVAKEFALTIAGVSNIGPITSGAWAGHRCIGCSLAVGPEGTPEAEGPYDKEALLLITLS